MSKKEPGFFESILQDIAIAGIVEASKDASGNVDPYKAAGIAHGLGYTSVDNNATLATYLGMNGAFNDSAWSGGGTSSFVGVPYWWKECEDGSEYDLYPKQFRSKEDYDEALHEAKYGWRDTCEIDFCYDVDPEDFETEKEYLAALTEAQNAWRKTCEDGSEYGLDNTDFDTEDEYAEALEEAKAKNAWRKTCEDDYIHGIYNEDYETEEEFRDALREAKYGWRDYCEDGKPYGVDPQDFEDEDSYTAAIEQNKALGIGRKKIRTADGYDLSDIEDSEELFEIDFPNKRKFKAACDLVDTLSYGDKEEEADDVARYEFILNNNSIAANYLTPSGYFLIALAIKENFDLPVFVRIEENGFGDSLDSIVGDIAKKNVKLAIDVWIWCIQQFYPYHYYDEYCISALAQPLYHLYAYPKAVMGELVSRLKDPTLCRFLMTETNEPWYRFADLAYCALQHNDLDTAKMLFSDLLDNSKIDIAGLSDAIEELIGLCQNGKELETMELLKLELFPHICAIDMPRIQSSIKRWQEKIDDYILEQERENPKYAYSRRNNWRNKYTNMVGTAVSPVHYDSEERFLQELHLQKLRWRQKYVYDAKQYNLNLENYEEEADFIEALRQEKLRIEAERKAIEEERRRELDLRRLQREKEVEERAFNIKAREQALANQKRDALFAKDLHSMKTFLFCKVVLPFNDRPYYYLAPDDSYNVGDLVQVPFGSDNTVHKAKIISVETHLEATAPYPVEKTKQIISKVLLDKN